MNHYSRLFKNIAIVLFLIFFNAYCTTSNSDDNNKNTNPFFNSSGNSNQSNNSSSGPSISITAHPESIPTEGSTTTLTIEGTDSEGRPLHSTAANPQTISINTNLGLLCLDEECDSSQTLKMTNGKADVILKSGDTPGTATVTAEGALAQATLDVEFTANTSGECSLIIESNDDRIIADGMSKTTLKLTAIDESAEMIDETEIKVSTSAGNLRFNEEEGKVVYVTTDNGKVELEIISSNTVETATITATFNCNNEAISATKQIIFMSDSGEATISLNSMRTTLFADGEDSTSITATVYNEEGFTATSVDVTFTTSLGYFDSQGEQSKILTTNEEGQATLVLTGGEEAGSAEIAATAEIEGSTIISNNILIIDIKQLGFIEFMTAEPSKLGVLGSGLNESSTVKFLVKDTERNPFPEGTTVKFVISSGIGRASIQPSESITDADGVVWTTLSSGTIATTVTIKATVKMGNIELYAESTPIAIVGAKPNARYLTLGCEVQNATGFIVNTVSANVQCSVAMADRFSNMIEIPTNITLRTEAGAVEGQTITETEGDAKGTATVSLRLQEPRPKDVEPYPNEPSIVYGSITHNPRDGLVTMIAATTGEEEFDDENGNGRYDSGEEPYDDTNNNGAFDPGETYRDNNENGFRDGPQERFTDLGEPFVDKDDDNTRDSDEDFIDVNQNGEYDYPNGVWDSDTQIYTTYHLLWSGRMATGGNCDEVHWSKFCTENNEDTFYVENAGLVYLNLEIKDLNLNPLSGGTEIILTYSGSNGKMESLTGLRNLVSDQRGMNVWVENECNQSGKICTNKHLIAGFTGGSTVNLLIYDYNPLTAGQDAVNYIYAKITYKENPLDDQTNTLEEYISILGKID